MYLLSSFSTFNFVVFFLFIFIIIFLFSRIEHTNEFQDLVNEIHAENDADICHFVFELLPENIKDKLDNTTFEESFFSRCENNKMISKGEKICKCVLEKMYGLPFTNVRPNWLKNPKTGRNLELDCYNDEIKIAVEYNGIQHYEWPNFLGTDKSVFEKQLERDTLKKELCRKNGVFLIIVPYHVKFKDIPKYIAVRLPEHYKKIIEP